MTLSVAKDCLERNVRCNISATYLCSDLTVFLTGADIPFDGGVLNLRG